MCLSVPLLPLVCILFRNTIFTTCMFSSHTCISLLFIVSSLITLEIIFLQDKKYVPYTYFFLEESQILPVPFICITLTFPSPVKWHQHYVFVTFPHGVSAMYQLISELCQHALESSTVRLHTASSRCFHAQQPSPTLFRRLPLQTVRILFPALMENWKDLRMFVFPSP